MEKRERMKYRYAAVVVLYKPDLSVKENILSYAAHIERIYAVDNSAVPDGSLLEWIQGEKNITYVSMHGNQGLAKALIKGCKLAAEENYDFVMTMDQDSGFMENAVTIMKDYIETVDMSDIGIVCPSVDLIFRQDHKLYVTRKNYFKNTQTCTLKNWVMTSGSFMDIRKYHEVGGFDEKLFIDHIDIDYGIKLQQHHYEIHQLLDARIIQRLGNSQEKKFLWKTVHPNYADPVRTYYIVRNQYYLLQKYGRSYKAFTKVSYLKIAAKILLYEHGKWRQLLMFVRGYRDGRRGRMGKCRYTDA